MASIEPTHPPLSGVRVLDVSRNLAGPLVAMHLADLGADVVKVEAPDGDPWREHEGVPGHPGRSRHHLQVNRGKRSICVDLTTDGGREIAGRLVDRSDVLVTNLRPGVPERLGLGYEACVERNPRLVYCAVSAYGERGPEAGRPGFALTVEAEWGFMADSDTEPKPSPVPVLDTAAPLLACTGILAALLERERSGRGQRVEVTLAGTAAALNAHSLVRLDDVADRPERRFTRAFYRPYRTADGWLAVAAYTEHLARRLCDAIGATEMLAGQPASWAVREAEITARLSTVFAERSTVEWMAVLAAAGVPAGPVREREAVLDDPQAWALGLLERVHDAELGGVTMTAPAVKLSRSPARMPAPGRHLGADDLAVMAELGYDDAEIADLAAARAIGGRSVDSPPPRSSG